MANPLSDVSTWAYLIQNVGEAKIDRIGALPVDLVVVDAEDRKGAPFDAGDIARMKGDTGKLVVCYLSIGEAETYRDYWEPGWDETPPGWLAEENPEWEGNLKVAYWDPAWQEIVFAMVDAIVDAGFDGLYLDIVDAFWYWESVDAQAPAGLYRDRMVAFVTAIRERAEARLALNGVEDPTFAIIGQNGEALAEDPAYLAAIDGIGKEDLHFFYPNGAPEQFAPVPADWLEGSQALLATAEAAGVETFFVEYVPAALRDRVIGEIRAEIRSLGAFEAPLYLATDRALERIDIVVHADGRVRFWGGDAADRIAGTPWRDVLKGGGGDDLLRGGVGGDRLLGGAGDDDLRGGRGGDVLHGGAGRDRATGGPGADRFVFAPGDGRLAITDFGNGDDVINLRGFDLAGIGDIRAAAVEMEGRLVIDLSGDKLVLQDLSRADLASDVFLF